MLIRLLLIANICVFGMALSLRLFPGGWSSSPPAVQERVVRVGNGTWTPSDQQIDERNQGVGWVFGRLVGAAQAPGSPNHSPFGKRQHP